MSQDVVAIARLIAAEEEVRQRCATLVRRIGLGPLGGRVEKVGRDAGAHVDLLRRLLGLPKPTGEPEVALGPDASSGSGEGASTWQGLVRCSDIEERLAEGYREVSARTPDPAVRELLTRLGREAGQFRNEMSLVAMLVTSFVP